jgi:hypothetical protein
VTEPDAPPPLARLCAAILLSGQVLDRLGRLVDSGLAAEARRNGGEPSTNSLSLQALIADARREARVLSRLSRVGTRYGPGVAPSETVGTAEAAAVLGVHQRTVQRRATEYGGRLVCGTWRLDRATVEAAASGIESEGV